MNKLNRRVRKCLLRGHDQSSGIQIFSVTVPVVAGLYASECTLSVRFDQDIIRHNENALIFEYETQRSWFFRSLTLPDRCKESQHRKSKRPVFVCISVLC